MNTSEDTGFAEARRLADAHSITGNSSMDIIIGRATIKYCSTANGWLLPAGPAQRNRAVRCKTQATQFALRMHEIILRNTPVPARQRASGG